MEVETAPQPDAVQQQQIQALMANVEKLTRQNEELRKTMESQNAKGQRTGENQNEEESNSQANRRDGTLEEDSTEMENKLRNMRKEMDELKSAMKDKGRENLDEMIRSTDSPFTNEVLNRPPTKILSPTIGVVWRFQKSLGSQRIIQDTDVVAGNPRRGDV